jgi:CheY-like chemotaxis protein
MGGKIWVESKEGAGSTFYCLLSFALNDSAAERLRPREAAVEKAAAENPLRVLLAEDNEVNRKFMGQLLRGRGHTIVTSANGEEAVRVWAEEGSFDLVLMDVQMPVMDGVTATRLIREQEADAGKRVPIIALTAYAFEEDRLEIMAQGFDGYVPKPVKVPALFAEMARCLTAPPPA